MADKSSVTVYAAFAEAGVSRQHKAEEGNLETRSGVCWIWDLGIVGLTDWRIGGA